MGGKNFGEFNDSLQIRQSLTCQLLVTLENSYGLHGLEFAKVYFAKCNLACYSPKFTPTKVSLYIVYVGIINSTVVYIHYCVMYTAMSTTCGILCNSHNSQSSRDADMDQCKRSSIPAPLLGYCHER